jgi:hypothetical protein
MWAEVPLGNGVRMSEVIFDFDEMRKDVKEVVKKINSKKDFAKIWQEADEAFGVAFRGEEVAKYLVGDAVGFSDQIDYSKKVYVMEGLCGFAWINVGDGRSAWAKWVKENKRGYNDYYGGVSVWSSSFSADNGQSVDRKEAGCRAAAKVFNSYGLKASAQSRLD